MPRGEVRLRQIGTGERLRVKEYKSIEHVGKLPLANTLCQKILSGLNTSYISYPAQEPCQVVTISSSFCR